MGWIFFISPGMGDHIGTDGRKTGELAYAYTEFLGCNQNLVALVLREELEIRGAFYLIGRF